MNIRCSLFFRLVVAIILGIAAGLLARYLETPIFIRIVATFNAIFGNFLGFCIPLIIIGFVTPSISELKESAGKLLCTTVIIAYTSTIISGLLAYCVNRLVLPLFMRVGSVMFDSAVNPEETLQKALFTIDMPPIMDVMTALLVAFVFGVGIAILHSESLKKGFLEVHAIVKMLVTDLIVPLLPFHVFGIFSNMSYTGTVVQIMTAFMRVFLIILLMHFSIIAFQYLVAGTRVRKNPVRLIKNMLPAYFAAIGTQSSAATIPVTVACAKSNGVNDKIAEFVCPLCATIHLSGSTITITSCAMAMMMLKGMSVSISQMFPFVMMLGVMMVAAPGVPGGAVMAALGILTSMLHFDESMLALMIAVYVAQDSFGTACNVTGDGAIAVLVDAIAKQNGQGL